MKKLALLAGIAALAAAPALAQPQPAQSPNRTAPPGTTGAGGTGTTSTTTTGQAGTTQRLSTQEFLQKAAMSDRFEIGSSRIAMERAQNQQVKQFAQEMVQDHTKTTEQRMRLMQQLQGPGGAQTSQRGGGGGRDSATGTGAAPGAAAGGGGMTTAQGGVQPEGLDARHQQMLSQLQAAQGPEFDRLYMQQQVQAHREAVQMFETYAQGGENAQLRQWASRTLPDLQDHLQKAQRLQTQLGS